MAFSRGTLIFLLVGLTSTFAINPKIDVNNVTTSGQTHKVPTETNLEKDIGNLLVSLNLATKLTARNEINQNKVVDEFIAKLRSKSQRTVSLPSFTKNISCGLVSCKLQGNEGWFGYLDSLERTGDVIFKYNGSELIISGGLGLKTAKLEYELKAFAGMLSAESTLSATVDQLEFTGEVEVDYSENPLRKAQLNHFSISQMGKIEIHLTGLGPLNSVASKILSSSSNYFKQYIINYVQPKIRDLLQEQLDDKAVLMQLEQFRKN